MLELNVRIPMRLCITQHLERLHYCSLLMKEAICYSDESKVHLVEYLCAS